MIAAVVLIWLAVSILAAPFIGRALKRANPDDRSVAEWSDLTDALDKAVRP